MTIKDNASENTDTKNELIEDDDNETVSENCYSRKDSSKVSNLENDIEDN